MTDFDYDPLSLNPPERLAAGVILDSAVAYRYRLATRHRHAVIREEQLSHDWIADPSARALVEQCVRSGARAARTGGYTAPVLFAGGDLSRGCDGWMEGVMTLGRVVTTGIMARAL